MSGLTVWRLSERSFWAGSDAQLKRSDIEYVFTFKHLALSVNESIIMTKVHCGSPAWWWKQNSDHYPEHYPLILVLSWHNFFFKGCYNEADDADERECRKGGFIQLSKKKILEYFAKVTIKEVAATKNPHWTYTVIDWFFLVKHCIHTPYSCHSVQLQLRKRSLFSSNFICCQYLSKFLQLHFVLLYKYTLFSLDNCHGFIKALNK